VGEKKKGNELTLNREKAGITGVSQRREFVSGEIRRALKGTAKKKGFRLGDRLAASGARVGLDALTQCNKERWKRKTE